MDYRDGGLAAAGRGLISRAQVYYTLSDGSFSTTADELRRSPLASAAETALATNFIASAGPMALDVANNRVLVADIRNNTPRIIAISLTAPYAASTFLTPAAISGATTTTMASLVVDNTNGFVYYSLSDGTFASSLDELRRSPLASAAETTLATNFIASPGPLALDLANNRILEADIRSNVPRIIAISLTAPYAASTFLTPAAISGATATSLAGIAVDKINGFLYYTLSDGSFSTTADQLRRSPLASAAETTLTTNFIASAGPLDVDPANNRVLVADIRSNAPRIIAVSLTAPYTASTFLTPAAISGATATSLTGIAVLSSSPPSVITVAATSITTTSAVLGGNVTADGGATVSGRGVVYSSSATTPAIGGSGVTQATNGSGTGSFSATISGLTPGTTYYVRAYAINSAGTSYGSTSQFTTAAPTIVVGPATLPNGTTGTAYSQTISASGGTSPYSYAVTAGALPTGLTLSSAGVLSGTPTASGSFNFTVTGTDAGSFTGSRSYSLSIVNATTTVASITRLLPSPTATAQVSYRVVFANSVTGVTVGNFNITTTGTVSGTNVSSVVGSGTTYTVTVSTGTGDGTLRLNVNNSAGITPTVTNVPYTSGETYTITKSFAAAPQLTIVGTGGTGSDVTAFVDVAQVLSGGSPFANGLQNGSFETHDPLANGDFGYQPTNASWSFNTRSGIAEAGSAFSPTTPIPNGIAVAFVQSTDGINGQLQQNLALPTGSNYQVRFQASQRICCTTLDQSLNVFLNGVFVGNIQPGNSSYSTFTSATFAVTAPALTATVSTTSASPTSTSPIPFSVSFSQSVGTSFTASDVTVTGGTLNAASFTGSGSGPYTFTVTPSGTGTVSVSLAANVANDANNTNNTASNTVSVQYAQPTTATPSVSSPANGSLIATTTPTYQGTAVANSTVTLFVDGSSIGTTTASASGTFALAQPTALPQGTHTVSATAQTSGSAVSANSNTNTFTIDSVRPTVAISSAGNTNGGTTSTSPIGFSVTFSEVVTGFVAGDLTVSNGSLSAFAGSGTTYTFNVTPTTDGAVTVNVPANVAVDAANNGNTAATQYSITYQQLAAPVVLVPANNSLSNNRTVTVSGTAPANRLVVFYLGTNPAATTRATASGTFSGVIPGIAPDGTYNTSARVVADDYTISTPTTFLSPLSNVNTFTIDGTAPTVSISSSTAANGGTTSTSPLAYTATFSETVTGFVAGDVTVSNGTVSNFTAVSGTSYTFSVTPAAGGAVTVSVPANVAVDAATNGNLASNTYSITFNQAVTATPSVSSPANGSLIATTTPTYQGTAVANSTVTLFVDGSSIGTTTASASGTFALAQPTALPQGTHTVSATAQTSGSAVSANSNTNTFTIDSVRPTVAISSAGNTNGGTTSTSPIGFSVTFSEVVTGFVAGDLTVSNGSLSAFAGSGSSYTFNVTPTTPGTATTVNVAANVAQDLAGNGNTAATQYSLTFTAPTIAVGPTTLPNGTVASAYSQTITASGGTAPYQYAVTAGALPTGLTLSAGGTLSGTPTANGTSTFTVTATDASGTPGPFSGSRAYSLTISSQPVTAAPVVTAPANGSLLATTTPAYTGTAVANSTVTVYVDGSSIGTTTATGSGTFSLTQPTALAQGSHTVSATAQASGSAVSANSNTNTFTIDSVRPTVALNSTTATNGGSTGTSPIAYTVTFSESVTGFVAGDLTVSNGSLSAFSGSGASYSFNVTPAGNGAVTVNVAANVAQDAAGNGNTAATQYSITYTQAQTAAPVVLVPVDGSFTNNTSITVSGTAPAGSLVTIYIIGVGGTTTATSNGTFSFTILEQAPNGTFPSSATAQLPGQAVSERSNINYFTVDTVRPTVSIASAGNSNGGSTATSPIGFSVSFSEAVTGFVAGDLTVSNGTVSNFAGSGASYTFNVTPAGNGAVTVNVPANVAQDVATNGNTAATPYSLTYTGAAPTATSWTGAVSTDWFTAGNWTSGVPTTALDATIPAAQPRYPVLTAGTANAQTLTLASGATLTQSGGTLNLTGNFTNTGTFSATGGLVSLNGSTSQALGGSSRTAFWNLTVGPNAATLAGTTDVQRLLTLNGNLNTNSQPFTLLSNATATAMVLNNGGAVVGTATVQRYIDPSLNPGLGYRHYSSPVQATTVADLATGGFSPVVNPAYNTAANPGQVKPFPTVYGYDEVRVTTSGNPGSQDFDKGFFSPATLSDQLNPGRGYTVNLGASEKVDLNGTLNNGTVPVGALSRGTQASSGWQLLGNPYPSPISWDSARFSGLPAGVQDAIYVYKSSSQYNGSYQTYVNGVGSLPGGLIGSMQGFFLRVSQNVPAFSFQNSWRVRSYQNPTFNRPTADTRPLVQLDLVSAQGTHEPTYVYFEQGATAGFDAQYDAEKLPNSTGLNLSSEAAGLRLAVNGLPPVQTSTTVPLAVGVPVTGTYTLEAASLANLGNSVVYLNDAETGRQVNLQQQPRYSFTASNAALITGRFSLSFGPLGPLSAASAALAAQVQAYPNPAHAQLNIVRPLGGPASATLLNVVGQVVRTVALPTAKTTLDVADLPTGLYLVRVTVNGQTVTKRVMVE